MSNVLKALAYFDVFSFPLNRQELEQFVDPAIRLNLDEELLWLTREKLIFQLEDFYALKNDMTLVHNRVSGDQRAKAYIDQAFKKSRLIAKFPYVRGVFISGSLSKGTMTEDGDIDYFIVTAPNRLWIARTLLIAYKKVFLLNSRKYFCINYLIDDETLEIQHKNRFTATELVTLWPIVNRKLYQNLMQENAWVGSFYPDYIDYPDRGSMEITPGFLQKTLEAILNLKWGDILDDFFMKLTLKRWRKKFPYFEKEDFEVALKTTKRVSKHHPSHFQKKVLEGYEQRISALELKMNEIQSVA
ncbi:nucleotidyltransferase domain-containing protein [bacterium SCSIO 12643]|nr:nucleotidyltransferase domain-containing protein [bacterium SCSIO 12643]